MLLSVRLWTVAACSMLLSTLVATLAVVGTMKVTRPVVLAVTVDEVKGERVTLLAKGVPVALMGVAAGIPFSAARVVWPVTRPVASAILMVEVVTAVPATVIAM